MAETVKSEVDPQVKERDDKIKKLQVKVANQKRQKKELLQLIEAIKVDDKDPVGMMNSLKKLEGEITKLEKQYKFMKSTCTAQEK